jgi:RNA polymerase sigma factor (sigma-70 family)
MPRAVVSAQLMVASQDDRLTKTFERERGRLRSFIRRRVADIDEADDILQDVFYELIRAERLMEPIEQISAWLFRVARNRIIDLFRRKKPETSTAQIAVAEDGDVFRLEDLLPSPDAGPDAAYARSILVDELVKHVLQNVFGFVDVGHAPADESPQPAALPLERLRQTVVLRGGHHLGAYRHFRHLLS